MSSAEVLDRMQQAMTAHDLEALVACFAEDYDCEMPTHPAPPSPAAATWPAAPPFSGPRMARSPGPASISIR
jgi:hypothetical protein